MLYLITATKRGGAFFSDMLKSLKASAPNVRYTHVIVAQGDIQIPRDDAICNFITLRDSGAGLYPALNRALDYISGRPNCSCFSYINDDDGILPGFWKNVAKHEATESDVTYGDVLYTNVKSESCGYASICKNPRWLLALFQSGIPGITQQGTIFSARIVRNGWRFNEQLRLAADSLFIVDLLISDASFNYAKNPVAFYRKRPGQLSDDHRGMIAEAFLVTDRAKSVEISSFRRNLVKGGFRLASAGKIITRWRSSGFGSTRAFFDKK